MRYYFYKIFDNNNKDEFYIGSTNNFSSRKSKHKKAVNNKVSKKYYLRLYQYIRANGGWDNFTMEIIHEMDLDSRASARKEEQAIIDILKPTLNSICASICKTVVDEHIEVNIDI